MRHIGVERADRLGVLEASAGSRRIESARHAPFHQGKVVGEMLVYAAAGGLQDFFIYFHSFLDMPLVTKAKSLAAAGACARACCVLSVYVCVNFI